MGKLTPKQKRFAKEYLVDMNATQAAIRAGYSKRSAEMTGSRMMRNDKVQEAVEKGLEKINKRLEKDQVDVRREIDNLAFMNAGDLFEIKDGKIRVKEFDKLTPDQRACLDIAVTETEDGVTVQVRMGDKLGALRDSAKLRKMFVEKKEFKGNFTINELLDELDDE